MTNARRTFPTIAGLTTLAALSTACGAGRDVGPGPAVPGLSVIAAGFREPPRVWSKRQCLRLADGRVAVASIGYGADRIVMQGTWVSEAPVVDFLCRNDGSIVLLYPDGRVTLRYFEGTRVMPERPYNDFSADGSGFEAKGGTRLVEVTGGGFALVCVTGDGGVRCPRDVKAIYGEFEAFGRIRNLYAQGRAALLEDGRFVLGGPQIHNDPNRSPLLLDRVVRAAIADLGFNHVVGCLVRDDASVWCWGPNEFGQLGDGTRVRHDEAVRVIGLPRVVDVSTSGEHACAIDEVGGVWCWGRSKDGETGEAGKEATEEVEVCPVDEKATQEARKWAEEHPPCEPSPNRSPSVEVVDPHLRRPDDPCGRLQWNARRAGESVRPVYKRVPGCVMPEELHEGHPVPVKIDEIEGAVAIEALPGRTWAVRRDGVIVMWGLDADHGEPRMQAFPVAKGTGASPSSR
ncbi:RCC1 domain-containing protein [Polyangium sp. y55x31]|uniref:RCC1 domain-containing protein n=1 Tax=Polyangium sp. y55x31 TaxID=3042688 RepID=UPI002482F551|nr:RCC1 domain-containing protein [Polyangium sp. y55x31]MDI1476753.1 hypothetical protein [Polyangium sp. y55x31]